MSWKWSMVKDGKLYKTSNSERVHGNLTLIVSDYMTFKNLYILQGNV